MAMAMAMARRPYPARLGPDPQVPGQAGVPPVLLVVVAFLAAVRGLLALLVRGVLAVAVAVAGPALDSA